MKKKILSSVVVFSLIMCFSVLCFAADYSFASTMKFVDSNSWSYIGGATKDTTGAVASVEVTEIYDANKKACNYNYVWAKATASGTSVCVEKGRYFDLSIPSSARSAGSWVPLYCKGNNPRLDCYIKGYWVVH